MTDELPRDRRLPLVERLSPAHPAYAAVIAAHEQARRAGAAGYLDPISGYFVFTASDLWANGTCCNAGCRHCPWDDGPRGPHHASPAPLPEGT